MVDADVRGVVVGGAVVRGRPGARRRVAVRAGLDAVAVAPQHVLARAAAALHRVPVREQVPVVASVVRRRPHRQPREQGARLRLRRDSGLCGVRGLVR